MREITPEHMAALAESASSALELLEFEQPLTNLVSQGIRDAEEFCRYLEGGLMRRQVPEKLSPTSLAEGELLELVFQIGDQQELQTRLPEIREELNRVRVLETPKAELSELRAFFSSFALRLDEVSGLHRKIAAEM
jgi:hypothetical protein